MRRIFLLLIVLAFIAPSVAHADDETVGPWGKSITNAEITTDGLLYEINGIGQDWWAERGHPLFCGTSGLYVYDEAEGNPNGNPLARASKGKCELFFERGFVAETRKEISTPIRKWRFEAYRDLCAVTLHEQGHEIGFDHEETGIMAPKKTENPPGVCFDWASKKAGTPKYTIRKKKNAPAIHAHRR